MYRTALLMEAIKSPDVSHTLTIQQLVEIYLEISEIGQLLKL